MKRLVIATATVLGFAGANSLVAAEQLLVNSPDSNYQVMVFVGHTPSEYAQAKRQANAWEGRRHLGLGSMSVGAIAIDATPADVAEVPQKSHTDAATED